MNIYHKQRFKRNIKLSIKKSDRILFILLLIISVSILTITYLSKKSLPVLMRYAKEETTKISTILVNEAVSEFIKKVDTDIEDIFITNMNKDDEIIGVDFNTQMLNESLYNINNSLLEKVRYLENGNADKLNLNYFDNNNYIYFVPYGLISSIPLFSGIGPKIPVKLNIIGSTSSYVNSTVRSYGINNSLIELFINIEVNIEVIMPFISDRLEIENKIPIGMKIIQGKVPMYYGGSIQNNSPILNTPIE